MKERENRGVSQASEAQQWLFFLVEWVSLLEGMEIAEIDKDQCRMLYEDLSGYRMPFGKYKGWLLVSLPDEYLMWFARQGFPTGRLGELMTFVYEVKMAGAEEVFEPIRRAQAREQR